MKPDRKLIDEIIANNDAIEAFCNPGSGAPAWNGEGLPPVGIECEALWVTYPDDVWYPVITLAHDEGSCVFRWKGGERKGGYSSYDSSCFRPLKTPEQLAAEQREKAINRLVGMICEDGAFDLHDPEVKAAATKLYDAGARLPE